MISRKFIKSSFIYTTAGALPLASAVILLPFYIHYLSTEVYGVLSLCLAFSIFIQIIVTYSFDSSLLIHYHELKADKPRLATFISSVFVFMMAIGGGVLLLFAVTGDFVFDLFFKSKHLSFYPYGLIAVALGVFQAIFKVHSCLLQTREQPEPYFWSNVFSFVVISASTIVGLKLFPGTLVGPLGGRLVAMMGSALWSSFRVFREFGFHVHSPWRYTSFSFNAYTFIYQLQQWVVNYIDRFIIMLFMPLSVVGIYDFAMKCIIPIELILNGLNASINPRIIKLINAQEQKGSSVEINRYFYGLVAAMMLMICVVVIAMPIAVDVFIDNSGYAASLTYIPYLALLFVFKSVRLYFVVPYSALKKMRAIMSFNFITSLGKIVLMVWLIPVYKVAGVILSAYAIFLVELVLLWYFLKDDYKMRFNSIKLFGAAFTLFGVIIAGELVLGARMNIWVHTLYVLVCMSLLVTAYRKELKFINPLKYLK